MSDASDIRSVTAAQVSAAIRTLGFNPDDVFAIEMNSEVVTVHYYLRYNGKLAGGRMVHTVPIDRSRAQD